MPKIPKFILNYEDIYVSDTLVVVCIRGGDTALAVLISRDKDVLRLNKIITRNIITYNIIIINGVYDRKSKGTFLQKSQLSFSD